MVDQWADALNAYSFDAVLGELSSTPITIFTDASDIGIGIWAPPYFAISYYDDFPPEWQGMRREDIAVREIFAIALALHSWPEVFRERLLYFIVDNTTAFGALKNVTTRHKKVLRFLRFIALRCVELGCRWFAHWIGSDENGPSDALSREEMQRFQNLSGQGFKIQREVEFCEF